MIFFKISLQIARMLTKNMILQAISSFQPWYFRISICKIKQGLSKDTALDMVAKMGWTGDAGKQAADCVMGIFFKKVKNKSIRIQQILIRKRICCQFFVENVKFRI